MRNSGRQNLVILVLLFACTSKLNAQHNHVHQSQMWYAYFNTLKFDDKLQLVSDVQERTFFQPAGAQSNFILRGILYYNLGKKWSAGFGGAFFLNSPQNVPSLSRLAVPELRPNLDFMNKSELGKFNIGHRFRAEVRFVHDAEDGKLVNGFNYSNCRFRYQLSADYPLLNNTAGKTVLAIKISDEIFLNFASKTASNTFDQNRVYGGFLLHLNNSFSADFGYINIFQVSGDSKTYYYRDVIRIGIHQRIDLSKHTSK